MEAQDMLELFLDRPKLIKASPGLDFHEGIGLGSADVIERKAVQTNRLWLQTEEKEKERERERRRKREREKERQDEAMQKTEPRPKEIEITIVNENRLRNFC